MRCVGCGCTNNRACPGGCSWVTHFPPKCSACIASGRLTIGNARKARLDTEDVCPDSPYGAHDLVWLNARSGYCGNCSWPFVATEVA